VRNLGCPSHLLNSNFFQCITTEQPPKNPCARCTKKHLPCEYVSVEEDDPVSANPSPDLSSSALPTSGAHSGRPQTQTPAWAGQPMPPSNHFSRGPGTAPPLPYTGPPPFNQPPRFSGSQYPDLSLYGSSQPSNPSPYYPAHANPALANQGTQAYQYGANSGPPPTQPGAQQPGSGGYPTGYGQMPYYGQTPMPGYGWPPQQGSRYASIGVGVHIFGADPPAQ
jgi:hypothetical protein